MDAFNPKNERIKHKYYQWLHHASQKSAATVDNIRKAIDRFEHYNQHKDFKTFSKHQAIAFKRYLMDAKSVHKKEPLSKSTLLSTVIHLKEFFKWLSREPGYKCIDPREVEYLNLTEKETRAAKACSIRAFPTIEQIRAVLSAMPDVTDIDKRNKALIAFTLLTGMRDGALASLKLKHIDLTRDLVEQLADEVKTKFSKTIYTYFFPVGNDIRQIVIDWINYLYRAKLFNGNNPVFPRTRIAQDAHMTFQPAGIEPIHWQSAGPIRDIFKEAFTRVGLTYYSPHSFRNTLVQLGEKICKTPEEFKAWSQNIGHETPSTTFLSYGHIDPYKQGDLIKSLHTKETVPDQMAEMHRKLDLFLQSQNIA